MNIYIIDSTTRPWSGIDLGKRFPEAKIRLVHTLDENALPETSPDDYILCHTHMRAEDNPDHPDFCLAGFGIPYAHSQIIASFCAKLIAMGSGDSLQPRVWLFTGGGIDERVKNRWVSVASRETGPLPGYESTRLAFWSPIAQGIAPEALKNLVIALLVQGAPRDPAPTLAFHLLCEATKMVEEKNIRRMANREQTSNTAELSTITIHVPTGLGAWLAPFGKSKPEEISQVAGMIGSGVAKEAAEKVLNAVNGSGDLPEAITKFLKLSEPQNP
jgi:hypothetical protein